MSITRTTKVSRSLSTNSDENGENFEAPQDASDILGIDTEISRQGTTGTPSRSPTGGGIDLRKGPDLQKPRSPTRGPGIGIEIGKSEAGNLGIGVEIPIPVPAPISARGKIAIDPATGKIRGGGLGIAIGKGPLGAKIDLGRDTPKESEKLGCFKYLTVSIGPFSHTFGKNECEPKPPRSLPPSPISDPKTRNYFKSCPGGFYQLGEFSAPSESAEESLLALYKARGILDVADRLTTAEFYFGKDYELISLPEGLAIDYSIAGGRNTPTFPMRFGRWYFLKSPQPRLSAVYLSPNVWSNSSYDFRYGSLSVLIYSTPVVAVKKGSGVPPWSLEQILNGRMPFSQGVYVSQVNHRLEVIDVSPAPECPPDLLPNPVSPTPPSYSPPIPNPQPTKKKMNDCCEITKALQLETLRMLGRQVVGGKLQPITNVKGFLGEEIARIETPIKDPTKPKTIKLKFNSIYELLVYCLKQSNNLDTALDPQSYKPVEGNLQNPEYRRDTKHSLTNNRQPGNDASGRRREFKINKDKEVIFRGFLQEQRYIFEAIKRFEYLFPYGEFSNFKIDKSLIVPSTKKAEMQIHNTFHAFEVLFQYLNSSLGNPREEIHIGDTNPGKEGSQPITFTPFSVSHLMREIFKYLVDLEGDQDSQLNLSLRDFRTDLANRVQIIQIHEMVKALFEDTGMVEQQDFVTVKLEGDPYAGNFKNGEFLPSEELDENTEEATEKLLAATLQNFEMQVKVLRRDNKKDPNDLRDVIIELYNKLVEQSGGTAGGDDLIKKELEKAKFNVELDGALTRVNVKKAQAASSYKTRKKRR